MVSRVAIACVILLPALATCVPWELVGASDRADSTMGIMTGSVTKNGNGGISWTGQMYAQRTPASGSGIRQVILDSVDQVTHFPDGKSVVTGSGVAMCFNETNGFAWGDCTLKFTVEDYGVEDFFEVEVLTVDPPIGTSGSAGILLARAPVTSGQIRNLTPYTPTFDLKTSNGGPVISISFDPREWRTEQERTYRVENNGPPTSLLQVSVDFNQSNPGLSQFEVDRPIIEVVGNSYQMIKVKFKPWTPYHGRIDFGFIFSTNVRNPIDWLGPRVVSTVPATATTNLPFFLKPEWSFPIPAISSDIKHNGYPNDGQLIVWNLLRTANGHPEDFLHEQLNFEIGEYLELIQGVGEYYELPPPFMAHQAYRQIRRPAYEEGEKYGQIWSNQHPRIPATMIHFDLIDGIRTLWFVDRHSWHVQQNGWDQIWNRWLYGDNRTASFTRTQRYKYRIAGWEEDVWGNFTDNPFFYISRMLRRHNYKYYTLETEKSTGSTSRSEVGNGIILLWKERSRLLRKLDRP